MSLSSQIANKNSSVSIFFAEQFPFLKSLQANYVAAAPDIQCRPSSANPGTVGTAYDWRVRLLIDPRPNARLPFLGAVLTGRLDLSESLSQLLLECGIPYEDDHESSSQMADSSGLMSQKDDEWLSRLAWVLACYTELFRARRVFPGSPLSQLGKNPAPEALLALASDEVCGDIASLTQATRNTLLPIIEVRNPIALGPTFAGSRAVKGADADIIAGGLLIDLKASAGTQRSDGSRRCSLGKETIYQLLGYVLLDWDDSFALECVGIYAVRFDYLRLWSIDQFLAELRIGRPEKGIEEIRRAFKERITI
jgi:hypothetical protein